MITLRLIYQFDYWTHLAMGQTFFSMGRDFFLSPNELFAGRAITWPFQVLVYGVETLFSHTGVSILVASLATFAFIPLLLRGVCRHNSAGSLLFILTLIGVVLSSRFRFIARPELLAYILFTTAMALACHWADKPKTRTLLGIAALLLIWKPLHPTLYIGGPLIIAFLASSPQKPGFWRTQFRSPPFLLILVPLIGVLLLYSGRFANYVFTLLEQGNVLTGVVEMRPSWHFPMLFWPFLITTALAFALALAPREGRIQRATLITIALLPGLLAVRNIPLSLLFVSFMAAEGVRRTTLNLTRPKYLPLLTGGLLVLALLLGGRELRMVDPPFGTGVQWDWFPKESSEFVARNHLTGPLFNNWDWGGYLLWSLEGAPKPFLDGRFNGSKEKLADYDRIFAGDQHEPLLNKYEIETILIRPLYLDSGRTFPLVTRLLFSRHWRLVDAQDALVFVRKDLFPELKTLPLAEGWRLIIRQAEALKRNDPRFEHPHLDFTRGLAYMAVGEYTLAQNAFQKGKEEFPEIAKQYSH
ncbi:MAG: hypothetical protein C0621_02700 [Desulfuromonas sp.]|nr:MAG: hypothetical protein C0621_02700 [Desulfuromonas sp.]